MNRKFILAAVMMAVVGSVGTLTLLPSSVTQSFAQQGDPHHPDQSQTGQQSTTAATAAYTKKMSMFNVKAFSMVNNVQVTGVSVTGDNKISASLRYTGEGRSPGVSVVAITEPTGMMLMMHGPMMSAMMGQGMMMGDGSNMTGLNGTGRSSSMPSNLEMNSTQGQPGSMMNLGNQTSMSPSQMSVPSQSGSNFLRAGWRSATAVDINLDGNASAYDASSIMVMVFPYSP